MNQCGLNRVFNRPWADYIVVKNLKQISYLQKKTCTDIIFKKKPRADGEINAGFLVLVHVVLKLGLPKLVEGDDDQGNEDVDKEEGKDNEEDDVEY